VLGDDVADAVEGADEPSLGEVGQRPAKSRFADGVGFGDERLPRERLTRSHFATLDALEEVVASL
jgi:hypothetical protein